MQKKYDMFGQEIAQNPYPIWKQMRSEDPMYKDVLENGQTIWYLSSYELVQQVLKDHHQFVNSLKSIDPSTTAHRDPYPIYLITDNMLTKDQPDHTRLRALVSKAFTPRMINKMEDRIQSIANELLDQVESSGEMDLIPDYAYPLPMQVISEMIGVPFADSSQFREWSSILISPPSIVGKKATPEEVQTYVKTATLFVSYFEQLIQQRRDQPKDDLISALLAAEAEGDHLTAEEIYGTLIILLLAGHETTVNLISGGTHSLLQNRDILAELQAHPERMPAAVEEMVRLASPVERANVRIAARDCELGGHQLKKGDWLRLMIGSASRDSAKYENPAQIDLNRDNRASIGFGAGIHYCIGAPLARLEGRIALNTLFKRLPDLRLAVPESELRWSAPALTRGLLSLPVAWPSR